AGGRLLSAAARRFHLAGLGAGRSSNRGRLDRGDRGVHAGQFPGVRPSDIAGRAAGDEQMSLIYSMLMSVDGYVEDEHGRFDWAHPEEKAHAYTNQAARQTIRHPSAMPNLLRHIPRPRRS